MDFFYLIIGLIIQFWYLIPILILIGVLQSFWFQGIRGEARVNRAAKSKLDKNHYHLFKNITLPTDDGTTQIDHIIVSRFGVFVIETKNMSGWIFGSVNQPYWTQQIFKHKSRFQNPIRQNYKHVKALEALLEIDPAYIYSLVVFVGDAELKTALPETVTDIRGYIKYVRSKHELVLSEAQVTSIIQAIDGGRLSRSLKTHRNHTRNVKALARNKKSNPRCPRCKSPMVLREAKKGRNIGKQFWGCTQFPKCRGMMQKAS